MIKWLMKKDSMGVERYLYILFWFFAVTGLLCAAIPPLAMLFGW